MATIYYILSNKCNQRCEFCLLDYRNEKELSTENTKKKIKEMSEFTKDCIQFTGGEPTLRKDIFELLRFSKECGIRSRVVITNGVMFSYKDYTKNMIEAGLNSAVVSVHSHDEKMSDKMTGTPGSFKLTMEGINNILETGININVTNVINGMNYKDLIDYVKFINRISEKIIIHFNFTRPMGRALENKEYLLSFSEAEPYIRKALGFCRKNNIRFALSACSVPICYLGGLEEYSDDVNSSYNDQSYLRVLDGKGSPKKFDQSFKQIKMKGKQCGKCSWDKICGGIWRDYAEQFGTGELRPYKGDIKEVFSRIKNDKGGLSHIYN